MSPPCIVRFCKNRGNHLFPSDEIRRAQWIQAIEHLKPGMTVRKRSQICSAHFRPIDFNRTPLSLLQSDLVPKTLKKTAIPTIFPWKTALQDIPVKSQEIPSTSHDQDSLSLNLTELKKTYARNYPITFVEEQTYLSTILNDSSEDPLQLSPDNVITSQQLDQSSTQTGEAIVMGITDDGNGVDIGEELEITSPEEFICQEEHLGSPERLEKSVQTEHYISQGFSIHHYKNNNKVIHFYTGLENFSKVMLVFHTLGQCAHNLSYFYGKPPQELDALEQFFITLLIIRRHKPIEEVAMMYQITIKQVFNIFITWIRFMSLQWRNLDLWVDRETVTAYMPVDFYDKYPSTRVVMDATECPIKKPKLPFAQQVTFSSYKNKNTVKFLIGITPSGLISYVSPCYGGSATDRQLIERSTILEKFNYNDEIMVDKGMNVQDIFVPHGVKVNMPSFFKKGNQIGSETLASNRKVASKRVHVERVIGLLKTFKIFNIFILRYGQPMNQTETMLSSDIVFVCAMLVNFRTNIINKNA